MTAHAPRLLMDALVDGTLPCATHLEWLSQHTAADYNSFMVRGVCDYCFFWGWVTFRLLRSGTIVIRNTLYNLDSARYGFNADGVDRG